jgi:hypothetical protein
MAQKILIVYLVIVLLKINIIFKIIVHVSANVLQDI